MAKALATHKQKGQKQGIELNTRVRLGKEEYQAWRYLRGRNLSITQKRFAQYLTEVAKANAKMNRLGKSDNFFGEIKEFSTDLSGAKDQEQLEKWLNAPSEVLKSTYEEDVTKSNREQLDANVEMLFGKGVSFKALTTKQLKKFFEEYKELKNLMFYIGEGERERRLVNLMFDNEQGLQMAIDDVKKRG